MNFSKAADALHVTQSAVSQAIKSLENQLGILLFHRQSRSVTLTYEGEVLFQHVEKAFHFLKSAENAMQSIKSLDEGIINIGASDTITRHFLIDSIKDFHAEYPRVKISIHNRPSPRSVEKLTSGELDFAIVNVSPNYDYEALELHPLTSLEHMFISTLPLSQKKMTLAELSKYPLVCLEKNATTRRVLEAFYAKHSVELIPAFEFGSFDVILEAVMAEMGIGFVPRKIAQHYLDAQALTEVYIKIGRAHV